MNKQVDLPKGEKILEERGMPSRNLPVPGSSARLTREYYDALLIEMRTIDAVAASTELTLWGESFSTPVMTAALSGLNKIHPDGLVEVARGAAKAGAVMWCGIGDEEELAKIIETGAKTIKIIKPYADTDLIFQKIKQAEKCGAFAVGMDIDFIFGPTRNRGYAMSWPVSPKTQQELKSYIQATKLPFVLKGILSGQDAQKALDIGAAGIVVSHHGGAVLDYAAPPPMMLPRIAAVVGQRIPVFADCGIAGGADAFKALALGAKAVSVGRAVMAGLAADGAEGVHGVIEKITQELRMVMEMTGTAHCGAFDAGVLHKKT